MSRIQTYIYAYRYMYIFWRKCIHRNWWRKTHFFPVFLLFLHWLLGKSLRVHTHFASNCLCNHKAFVWLFHSYIFSRIQIQIHRWKMYKLYVLTVRSADFSLHFRYIFTHAASVCAGVCMCVRVCVCVCVFRENGTILDSNLLGWSQESAVHTPANTTSFSKCQSSTKLKSAKSPIRITHAIALCGVSSLRIALHMRV